MRAGFAHSRVNMDNSAFKKPSPSADGPPVRRSESSYPNDRRGSPRVAIEAEIGLHSETNFYQGFTEDLSDGGLFIATYDVLPVDAKLTVKFSLPDGHQIIANGRVVWVRDLQEGTGPGMGIEFEGLRPDDHAAILHFIELRPALFYSG